MAKETSFKSFVENVTKSYMYTIKDFNFNVSCANDQLQVLFIFSVFDWN